MARKSCCHRGSGLKKHGICQTIPRKMWFNAYQGNNVIPYLKVCPYKYVGVQPVFECHLKNSTNNNFTLLVHTTPVDPWVVTIPITRAVGIHRIRISRLARIAPSHQRDTRKPRRTIWPQTWSRRTLTTPARLTRAPHTAPRRIHSRVTAARCSCRKRAGSPTWAARSGRCPRRQRTRPTRAYGSCTWSTSSTNCRASVRCITGGRRPTVGWRWRARYSLGAPLCSCRDLPQFISVIASNKSCTLCANASNKSTNCTEPSHTPPAGKSLSASFSATETRSQRRSTGRNFTVNCDRWMRVGQCTPY